MVATATAEADIVEEFKQTSLGWQSENLKIIDKNSRLVHLDHNITQMRVEKAMQLQRQYHLPIMLLIYKARQEGVSTKIEADIFERVNRMPNRHACVVSMDDVSTNKVFGMCRIFQEQLPDAIKHPTERSNAREIKYSAPHRSSILCQTAGTKTLGRGGTTNYIHATEVTFWANAEAQLLGLLQEVPDAEDTMIVLETTANGIGNAFSKRYWDAVKRLRGLYKDGVMDPTVLRGYLPIFLSWQDFPEYQMPLPKGSKEVPGMTPEMEKYIQEGLDMTPPVVLTKEQIYFALLKVQNKCGGNYDLFKQEYPRTAREAERSSGRMVFNAAALDKMERQCRPPVATIEFYMSEATVKYRHVNRSENCWSVWKYPIKNHGYIVFGDVAEGLLSDPKDTKSRPDRSVAVVLDRTRLDIPMVYYGRPDTIEYGDQMVMASKFFNYAWSSPEVNSIGQSILDAYKRAGYQYIFNRQYKEETEVTEDSDKLGWKTTTLTRKPMIADMQKVVNDGQLIIYDVRIIDEMRLFIWNQQGKPEGRPGENDDCVIAMSGAVQLHQRCPFHTDFSWADRFEDKDVNLMAVVGATDFDDDDDGDDLMYEDMSGFE